MDRRLLLSITTGKVYFLETIHPGYTILLVLFTVWSRPLPKCLVILIDRQKKGYYCHWYDTEIHHYYRVRTIYGLGPSPQIVRVKSLRLISTVYNGQKEENVIRVLNFST